MNPNLQRAFLLLDQSRYREAEEEARRSLQQEPDEPAGIAVLALCFLEQKRPTDALKAARAAIAKDPDVAYFHYVHARVLVQQDKDKEAVEALDRAIQLDPDDADYHALRALIFVDKCEWDKALENTERGLAIDPEHEGCVNLRSMCLTKMGKSDHAGVVLDDALSRNPDNAFTHANKGWTLLHQGDYRRAETHFREALRLDPNLEHARLGVLQSLRGRHFFYRPVLQYFLWMSRFSGKSQMMIIVGLWFGMRILRVVAKQAPATQAFILPVLLAYAAFVYLSWSAVPLTDLLLFLHPFGRLALSPAEKRSSALVGLTLFGGLGCLGAGFAMDVGQLLFLGVLCVLMVIPMSSSLRKRPGGSRAFFLLYTAGLWAAGLGFVFLDPPLRSTLLIVFLIGFVAYSWIANIVNVSA